MGLGEHHPEAAIAARERGSAAALRRILGDLADAPGLARAADLATKAAISAPTEGRALYAGAPGARRPRGARGQALARGDPAARAPRGRPQRRPGRRGHRRHEAHVLLALSHGMPAEEFGRIHHLPKAQLAAVVDGLRARGLVDAAGGFTDAGRETKERIEALTDELAAPAYDVLEPDELDELIADLEPIAASARRRRVGVTTLLNPI